MVQTTKTFSTLPKAYRVSAPKQLEILTSPLRQDIITIMEGCQKPVSILEVAQSLARPADSLYYHFGLLEKSGLVVHAGNRLEHGKPVSLYLPIAKSIRIKYDLALPRFRKIIAKIFRTATKLTLRNFERAVESESAQSESETRNLYFCQMETFLSNTQLAQVNKHIDKITEIFAQSSADNNNQRCSIFIALSPNPQLKENR